MTKMELAVNIDGRDALPVRAIPYVTGWSLHPDNIARFFARAGGNLQNLGTLCAYRFHSGGVVEVRAKQWDPVFDNVRALMAQLKKRFPTARGNTPDPRGKDAWREQSSLRLPAGVFVWVDEFEPAYRDDFAPEIQSLLNEREGDRDLIDAPWLEGVAKETVLEGFETCEQRARSGAGSEGKAIDPSRIIVDRNEIMRVFRKKNDARLNEEWWDGRLSRAGKWLKGARVHQGRAGESARWDLLLVAHALLDKKRDGMTIGQLNRDISDYYPELLNRWKEETTNFK